MTLVESYLRAQHAFVELKASILEVLLDRHPAGVKNSELGKVLGIYAGHVGHVGHVPRTLLAMLQEEGLVYQDLATKCWHLRTSQGAAEEDD